MTNHEKDKELTSTFWRVAAGLFPVAIGLLIIRISGPLGQIMAFLVIVGWFFYYIPDK